jgi:hypothetical protein
MRPTRPLPAALLAGLLAAPWLGSPASAVQLSFAQGGFPNGGSLAFSVTGSDLNGDGFLERFNSNLVDEVTGFELGFSGNAVIADFSLGLAELLIFNLSLATRDFLDLEAVVFAGNNNVAYVAGGSVGADCVGVFGCGVVAALDIEFAGTPLTQVPAPAGLPLLGLALSALIAARRRRG